MELVEHNKYLTRDYRKKIVFFVVPRGDSFINDIIHILSEKYDIRKIIVTDYKQIDVGMQWADICWFEWCDSLVIYGSKLKIAKEKTIICRLHSYEAFTDSIMKVNWSVVNKLIFVAEHIKKLVVNRVEIDNKKIAVIPNGVDVNKYKFKNCGKGFNIAFIGYIDFKKGPMLLIHTFNAVHNIDNRYKLYIAGQFKEERYNLYFNQMIEELGLNECVFYDGWQKNIDEWLEDKEYIICTSVLESQNMSVMQAMSKGIKPIVHNFVGAKQIYSEECIWNTIDDAVKMIISDEYNSKQYREFIENKYSLKKQIESINKFVFN
jgi:Glycosyltransferase